MSGIDYSASGSWPQICFYQCECMYYHKICEACF